MPRAQEGWRPLVYPPSGGREAAGSASVLHDELGRKIQDCSC
jgi:hypothetical protein